MGGGGFSLDALHKMRNNRMLLKKNRKQFKSGEKYFVSLDAKSNKKFNINRGKHYKLIKKDYNQLKYKLILLFLFFLFLIVIFTLIFKT